MPAETIAVIFDPGNPENSVGIVGKELLELGSLYENFEVIGFEKQVIIVKELETQDAVPWHEDGEIDPKIYSRAKQFFVVKQMRAIYQAQLRYRDQFGEQFAPDLKTLLAHGLLADGFEGEEKESYIFRIQTVGQTPRMALLPQEPTFFAVAEPQEPEEDPFYFSVDYLGQVRVGTSLNHLRWAPIWDYADRGVPRQREITIE